MCEYVKYVYIYTKIWVDLLRLYSNKNSIHEVIIYTHTVSIYFFLLTFTLFLNLIGYNCFAWNVVNPI